MLKLADNPPMRTPNIETIGAFSGTWWVARTKSRFEKAFAWDLLKRGIGYFLPMIQRRTFRHGRGRKVLAPLFPGYLFFVGNNSDRLDAFSTGRVRQVFAVNDQQKFISELTHLERALMSDERFELFPFAAVGRRCRVQSGALKGVEGIVIHHSSTTRLVLQVTMLGQATSCEISLDQLEPAD
jgi:transcription antitermination factor NusG